MLGVKIIHRLLELDFVKFEYDRMNNLKFKFNFFYYGFIFNFESDIFEGLIDLLVFLNVYFLDICK